MPTRGFTARTLGFNRADRGFDRADPRFPRADPRFPRAYHLAHSFAPCGDKQYPARIAA